MIKGDYFHYTLEIAKLICDKISTNPLGLKKICEKYPELPSHVTIHSWRNNIPEFAEMYYRAKSDQMETFVDEMIDLSNERHMYMDEAGNKRFDAGLVGYLNAAINTRKWLAGKLSPRLYADKFVTTSLEKDENIQEVDLRIKKICAEKEKNF